MAYIGNSVSSAPSTPATDFFSGNGVTTTFTLSRSVQSFNEVNVYVNNVPQNPFSAFGINGGNQIVFSEAPSAGSNNIYVRYNGNNISTIGIGQGTIGSSQLATGAPIWDVSGNVTISGNLLINSSGAMMMPSGTTAQRPNPAQNGMVRYNTDLKYIEEYRSNQWVPLSTVFSATGGTESISGGYKYHIFFSSGTFSVKSGTTTAEYLIVGGGGSGGGRHGGGGGGGGFISGTATIPPGSYPVIVGSGGAAVYGTNVGGNNGGNSSFFNITALGGGGGGSYSGIAGKSGGSGGGAGHEGSAIGTGTSGQGFNGGSGSGNEGGGGGGANGVGGNAISSDTTTFVGGGAGGAGRLWSGDGYYYGGGGGGAGWTCIGGDGGAGGGGGGNSAPDGVARAGFGGGLGRNPGAAGIVALNNGVNYYGGTGGENTGGGGGGSGQADWNSVRSWSGAGGSGIVIIRYLI